MPLVRWPAAGNRAASSERIVAALKGDQRRMPLRTLKPQQCA
jgi:hypothetical protein